METEHVTASTTIEAAPEAVFSVLADPSAHADIDGTGWVRACLDLVFDAHLWHSGRENTSDTRRRVVQMTATRLELVPGVRSRRTGLGVSGDSLHITQGHAGVEGRR